MCKPIIITASGKARHGKDTFCNLLAERLKAMNLRVLRIAYADYMKYIAQNYFGWRGEKDEEGRTLLQRMGTDMIRKKDPSFWVDTVIRLVNVLGSEFDYVVISDCRFENEITRWKEERYNIISVHIVRPDFDNGLTEDQKNHESETALYGYPFDYSIKAATLQQLKQETDIFIKTAGCGTI